jgi:hypothetical protein
MPAFYFYQLIQGLLIMKKIIIGLFFFCFSFSSAQAIPISIASMNITSANISGNFLPPMGLTLMPTGTTNLVGGYINGADSIIRTPLMGSDQIIYTAAANLTPNGNPMAPPVGSIAGGPAPTGTLDAMLGTINMDLSSWIVNHFGMDQNLGSANASGTWDSLTSLYTLSWDATLTQGMNKGKDVTWALQGSAHAVPAPVTLWLIAIGLIGMISLRRRNGTT